MISHEFVGGASQRSSFFKGTMPLVNFWGMTSHLTSMGICSRRICQDDAGVCRFGFFLFWCCLCWQPGDSTMLSSSLLVAKIRQTKHFLGWKMLGKLRPSHPRSQTPQVVAELKPEEREHVTEAGELSNIGNG